MTIHHTKRRSFAKLDIETGQLVADVYYVVGKAGCLTLGRSTIGEEGDKNAEWLQR